MYIWVDRITYSRELLFSRYGNICELLSQLHSPAITESHSRETVLAA